MGRPKKLTMEEALKEVTSRSKPLTKTYLTLLRKRMSVKEWARLKSHLRSTGTKSMQLYSSFVSADRRASGKRQSSQKKSNTFSSTSFYDVSPAVKGVGNESVIMSTLLGDYPDLSLDIRRWWVVMDEDGNTDYRPTKKGIRIPVSLAREVLQRAAQLVTKLRIREEDE